MSGLNLSFICFLIFLQLGCIAQIVYTDLPPFSDSTETNILYKRSIKLQDSLLTLGFGSYRMEILEIDTNKYMLADGRLEVFEWKALNWVNISNSKFHGYNFRSKKFSWNGNLFCFGGYGFWREHGDLIRYEWDRNEWEIVQPISEDEIGNNVAFLRNDNLCVVNPIVRTQNMEFKKQLKGLYEIDLSTKKTNRLNLSNASEKLLFSIRLETNNYYLASFNPLQLIDKRTLLCCYSDLIFLQELYKSGSRSFIIIRNDSLLVKLNDSISSYTPYDLAKIFSDASDHSISLLQTNYWSGKTISITLIFITLLAGLYFIRAKRKSVKEVNQNPFLAKIMQSGKAIMTQEEIDLVFGIEHIIPAETKRSKRASIIQNINLEYRTKYEKDLIIRIQNPDDRRFFLYKLNP